MFFLIPPYKYEREAEPFNRIIDSAPASEYKGAAFTELWVLSSTLTRIQSFRRARQKR